LELVALALVQMAELEALAALQLLVQLELVTAVLVEEQAAEAAEQRLQAFLVL
jgi:hypothetical protein